MLVGVGERLRGEGGAKSSQVFLLAGPVMPEKNGGQSKEGDLGFPPSV